MTPKKILSQLLKKGVTIPCPDTIEIGPDIDPDRISGLNVTLHGGCRLYGGKTLIMSGAKVGYEAPVTIHDCQLGKNVQLNGGFFTESCFLDGASMGSGAQIRKACLLEEGARGAHCVGLKHTILFPFVTLGSLINFCDCLMAGGTTEKNHSEVGSSYVHFNYTPNQDKATASMMGDVPKGVMLNQKPVFLGGQGGLVGPVNIGYGVVVGAGNIVRKDIMKEGLILVGQAVANLSMPFVKGLYSNYVRIITRNTNYIANLIALRRWHLFVRTRFITDPIEKLLMEGAVEKLDMAISERIKQLGQVAENMTLSIEIQKGKLKAAPQNKTFNNQQAFFEKWPDIKQTFAQAMEFEGDGAKKDGFLKIIDKGIEIAGKDYLQVIRNLSKDESETGTLWLQGLVDQINNAVFDHLPGIKRR